MYSVHEHVRENELEEELLVLEEDDLVEFAGCDHARLVNATDCLLHQTRHRPHHSEQTIWRT